ncbi:hypothetical protein A3B02_00380 [Candidatus Roizmanbacteria bacterium RIFCSPLOWO2_01_FULL_42_14]|uniref:Uncharacterized protein n=4 Tax=Candidatus Roizmaniibacteriota TaxID=1752723 RepID=A0A1F7K000_9BACT|nr:MAG: hypothetical protein A3D08_02580 [Candidatus Roizmanbacteria bacterium RIFCSPHIGHO2_02_FULL_43_11]OGK38809.1 MAG: hypothetical protein A3F32_01110 [Candidatus Roizmanbacteria bacterium RIFCSPHIGHO2_12_FULL_42_10]OGK52711.1 MAG: hypothetical protein A3B02_00380 [Candidatus Roizmanbacteria bacterium RIFCSPLOWO2_01_FULL_42_14]OGK61178.1 MAG: hypothetical protein A3I56_03740 [Candidatus Roizmanbacteria bacterium RIFCSPLOWO2_02_FULL_43_10]
MLTKRSITHKVKDDLHAHVLEYLLLFTSAMIFLLFLSLFRGQPSKQFIATSVFVLYYIVWGITHHTRDQSLHLKIVFEYILIGALAMIVLRALLV